MELQNKIVGLAMACLIALIGWQLHQTWSLKEEVLKLQQGQIVLSKQIKKNTNFIKRNIKKLDKKNKNKKKKNETFAGCRVFALNSEEYNNCLRGRNKFERWSRKLNMEELNNQSIRTYAHQNPGQPIIIKDSTTGIMAYLIPPKR